MRKTVFQNDHYYHVYNRGVDKRDIFVDNRDYIRFLLSLREFNRLENIGSLRYLKESNSLAKELDSCEAKLVDIICYCLLPNHYHFILRQLSEDGVSKFLQKIGTGYTNYFNFRYNRVGALFQGKYKSILIKSDSYLNYLSAYIHGNPEIHKINKAEDWKWSSYQDYLGKRNGTLINKNIIMTEFKSTEEYKNYVNIVIKESGDRKDEIKKYFLE